ncbi:amino acid racemase [Sphingomonas sp. SM33]|uniref:Amino acid racemase n=1 Tax=Sphingomonas telluris TaxID=2907998 RepID=A0ABS9VQM7_9SPHN|nr:amino acid racemase [Sphingomonas telluris]MCH8617247.1 amino acid racemase [Sphingomonas telluris]
MRFGILAHSAEGAALCFLEFCRNGFREEAHMHPDVMLDCEAMGRIMPAWDAGDHPAVRAFLAQSIARLADGGCDFFACPDNTAHIALESAGPDLPLPGLNIGDIVADQAAALGMTRVAMLGTRFTMGGPVYRRSLPAVGIEPVFANEQERADVDRIIFDELVEGVFTEPSRRRYVEIIDRLKREGGCDGVALVCTEIPLLVTADVSPLPILDSTRLLARAAFEVCTGRRPFPTWRGGPVG